MTLSALCQPELTTARLRLRPWRDDDIDDLLALDSDERVRRYVDMPNPPTREQYQPILARWRATRDADPRLGYWIAEDRDTRAFLGWFHLRPPRHVAEAIALPGDQELGYRLAHAAWGRGLATEGGRALLDHGFRSVASPRILAACLAPHAASRRVMEKLGMRLLAQRDYKPGMPAVVYGLERPA